MTEHRAHLSRRAFIGALGGGALAVIAGVRLRPDALLALGEAAPAWAAPKPFRAKLPIPRVLRGSDIKIPIRPARIRVLPGRPTTMWTFGGTFPGPTIRRRAGERTRVTFTHRLPAKVGELTVHLHGGHNRTQYDGQPGGLTKSHPHSFFCPIPQGLSARASGNNLLLRPGHKKTYVYDLIEDGIPERAAFQWYHDHRLDHTGRNVWHGLAGMWIIDDEVEDALPLPKGDRDIPLMIVDRAFDRHNQLTNPFGGRPPYDGVTGNIVLVNGAYKPRHAVLPQRYRLRILNAGNFRPYNVYLSNHESLVQVGTDSGLMPAPVARDRVLLGPAERAEVIVDFSGSAGRSVNLLSGPVTGQRKPPLGANPYRGALMQFRVAPSAPAPDETSVPDVLRPLPAWAQAATKTVDKEWKISISGGFVPSWLINGRTFNPARVDHRVKLGTTETWRITNTTVSTHVMHMHHTDWYLLERDGRPPDPWEDCLKDSFLLRPRESILVAGHFSDFAGRFVIHCHMLDHEDHGLMTQFEVVA